MTKKKITLEDVDGTVPGRAALVSMDLANPGGRNGGPMYHDFVEGEGSDHDPILRAQALQESIEDDWPNHTYAVLYNARAQYLATARQMREIGFENYTPQEYLAN
ncbi:hypothetical protein [Microbispora sp. NPDC049125]|uniref:hypothetical protein n=1 Tax=Microbispora sp. NPDC049125 TaxID=3154929 RepID=UPI00346775D4